MILYYLLLGKYTQVCAMVTLETKLIVVSIASKEEYLSNIKPGLHCPDCGARWSPMAKWAGFVSTSANSEGTSVNNVTLPGNILSYWQ